MESRNHETPENVPADDAVVRYRKRSPNLPGLIGASLGAIACGGVALVHPVWGVPTLILGIGAVFFAIRLIAEPASDRTFLEINHEGVRIHPDDDRPARFIRWEILRGVHRVEDNGQLHFTLSHMDWRATVPAGVAEPDTLPARIIALRPPHIPPANETDADAALDAAFGFRTPDRARLLRYESHHDGTARWDLQIPDATLAELRSKHLRCSAWYALPPDMRFGLGCTRPARDDIPDHARYAIGEGHGHARTPVLIHDPRAHRLICLLVHTMG